MAAGQVHGRDLQREQVRARPQHLQEEVGVVLVIAQVDRQALQGNFTCGTIGMAVLSCFRVAEPHIQEVAECPVELKQSEEDSMSRHTDMIDKMPECREVERGLRALSTTGAFPPRSRSLLTFHLHLALGHSCRLA